MPLVEAIKRTASDWISPMLAKEKKEHEDKETAQKRIVVKCADLVGAGKSIDKATMAEAVAADLFAVELHRRVDLFDVENVDGVCRTLGGQRCQKTNGRRTAKARHSRRARCSH